MPRIVRVILVLSWLALVAAGCRSFDWNQRIKNTPANWDAICTVTTKSGFKLYYIRDTELASRRIHHTDAVGAIAGLAGDRVVAKRKGDWIYYRVERWNRLGIGPVGQTWDLRALVPDTEQKLYVMLRKEPGAEIGPWTEVHSDDNFLPDEGTVEIPDNAPEYHASEDYLRND